MIVKKLDEMSDTEQESTIDACFSRIDIRDLFDADVDVVPMDYRHVWWKKEDDIFTWADEKEDLENDDGDYYGGEILRGHFYKKGNYVLVHYKVYMGREEECLVVRADKEVKSITNEDDDED